MAAALLPPARRWTRLILPFLLSVASAPPAGRVTGTSGSSGGGEGGARSPTLDARVVLLAEGAGLPRGVALPADCRVVRVSEGVMKKVPGDCGRCW